MFYYLPITCPLAEIAAIINKKQMLLSERQKEKIKKMKNLYLN